MDSRLAEALSTIIGEYAEYARSKPLPPLDSPEQYDFILETALSDPNLTAVQIVRAYEQSRRRPLKVSASRTLTRYHIRKEDGRKECVYEIGACVSCLNTILQSAVSSEVTKAHRSLREQLSNRRRSKSGVVVARITLRNLGRDLLSSNRPAERDLGHYLEDLLRTTYVRTSKRLLRDIADSAVRCRGLSERESITDTVKDLIETVDDFAGDETEEKQEEPGSIEEENADLKAALFGLRHELTELSARIQEMQDMAQTDAISAFLTDMNSPASGHLLDNVIHSGQVISRLLSDGWQPEPPELEGVIYSLKMLSDFIVSFGLSPIYDIGARTRITWDDLATISYTGSEFANQQEKKYVEFRTPGWKFRDRVIAKPQAIEVDRNAGGTKE